MKIDLGKNLVKTVLFIFNLFFAISGIGLIIAGSIVISDIGEFEHFVEGRALALPIILIVIGVFVFAVASMGCYGAIRESPPLLLGFAVFLGIIFILELAIGIAAIVYKSELQMALKDSLELTIRRSTKQDLTAWDHAQRNLMCCGVSGPADWVDMSKNKTLRTSCCKPEYIDNETKDCRQAYPLFKDKYFQSGCVERLEMRIGDNTKILIGVGIGIAFIQLIGIFLACWLAAIIKNEKE